MGLGCGWGWWGLFGWCLGVRGLGGFGGLGLVVWLWVGFSDNKICRLLRFFFDCLFLMITNITRSFKYKIL